MSRERNGEMRNVNSALETINAAATAIASAESRVPPPVVQKRRWGGWWSSFWCFGSKKPSKRIGHAVLHPEPTTSTSGTSTHVPSTNNVNQPPASRAPFIAPPSSPASFLPSEPQSAVHSPAGSVGLNSNMYSPGGPRSIFSIGPYANETQLVTPPVFSTYTTEPSTAPFTPPPESVHLTTPSSPEVPFAQLLGPGGSRFPASHYEFQSYLLHPGSPAGPLISPGSAFSGSGTSSPFPDRDYLGGVPYFPDPRYGVPQKPREWGSKSQQASGSVTPDGGGGAYPRFRYKFLLDRQDSTISPLPNMANGHRNNDVLIDHRVSFELTAEDVVRCVEKKTTKLPRALQISDGRDNSDTKDPEVDDNGHEEEGRHQKQRAASLGSIKEFNFDHSNQMDSDDRPCVASNWWANEKVVGNEVEGSKNWSFFPMIQPGCQLTS